jgi:type I restriction enzyme, S subunit
MTAEPVALAERWKEINLGQACQITMGQSPPSSTYNTVGNGLPFLQGKADFGQTYPSPRIFCTNPLKVARKGCVLISVRAPVGDVNLADRDYIVGRGLAALSLGAGDNEYLYYLLTNQKEKIQSLGSGTTFQSINKTVLEGLSYRVPPLDEQRAIARALGTVRRAREARQRELVLEREHKAALMECLFSHGTRGGEKTRTEVGQLPVEWKVVPLGEVVSITYGIQAAVAHLTDPTKGIPILTNINIRNDGRLDFTTLRYFPLPEWSRERGLLKKGDVLFNWRSGSPDHVGKTALFNEEREFTYSSFILRLRPTDKVRSVFLSHYLHAIKARGYFSQNRQQSSVNSVFNASVAATIPVGLPTLEEQDEIANALGAADRKIVALEREHQLAEELFRAMLEELMTGRLSAVPMIEERQAQ